MIFTVPCLFDVRATFESGQPIYFLWHMKKPWIWWRVLHRNIIEVRQAEDGIEVSAITDAKDVSDYVRETFRFDDDLIKIYNKIGTDKHIKMVIETHQGLRLCKSDPWETIVCFIISQNNNLKRIKTIVQGIKTLGEHQHIGTGIRDDHIMPTPDVVAQSNLRKFRLGYREPYLKKTAKLVSEGFLDGIEKKSTSKAKELLMQLPGVGPKVADCILLFGLGRTEVFPVDVWIQKVMAKYYKVSTPEKIQKFASKRWGKYAGYAQQYLYYWAMNKDKIRDESKIYEGRAIYKINLR